MLDLKNWPQWEPFTENRGYQQDRTPQGTCRLSFHASLPRFTESEGDGVKALWESRGDPMKIMALRVLINPASEAGHVVLSSIPAA